MHFGYTRAGGVWIAGTVVTAAEAADFDAKIYKALNADDGGDWSPAAIISLAGAGLRLYGAPFRLYDSIGPTLCFEWDDGAGLASWGDCVVSIGATATLQIEDLSTFNIGAGAVVDDRGDRTCIGDWDLSAGTWTGKTGHVLHALNTAGTYVFDNVVNFNGVVAFGTDVSVQGDATLSHNLSVGTTAGDLAYFVAKATFDAMATFNGDVALKNPVTLSTDGRIRTRVTTGADADTTYNVNQYDEVHVVNGALSADRNYTIADGAPGEHIRIMNHDIAKKINLKRGDASSICSLQSGVSTLYGWVDLVWITRWEISAYYYHQ